MAEAVPEMSFELLERLRDAVTGIDSTCHYRYVSSAAAAWIGQPVEHLVGAYVWDVFPEVVGSRQQQAAIRAMEGGEPVDIVWFFDRVGRWFEQRAVPTSAGMIVVVNDVTDREVTGHRAERLVELGQELAGTTTYGDV